MTHSSLENQEEEKEENNVTEFKLLQGGKTPPTDETNWLSTLEVGTVFLVQDKTQHQQFALGQFRLMEKTVKSCFVATMLDDKIQTMPVNPVRFCAKFSLWETLAVIKTTEELEDKKEEENESGMESKMD